jgi:hypothetical protein
VDNLCLYNGFTAADGTVGAYITWRFMLGPLGSLHEFVYTIRTGPDYGQPEVFLASIPEDDATSGYANPAGILKDISALTFVKLVDLQGYSAGLTRNVQRQMQPLRVMGADGAPLTTITTDADGNRALDGGAGPYAMKIVVSTKTGASTGFKFDLQDLHRKRTDWAFG